MRIRNVMLPLVLLATGPSACGQGERAESAAVPAQGQKAETPKVELGAASQLDSGNAAYRRKDYGTALGHYTSAARRQPDLAAAWFGIYMANRELGDSAAADSAMRRVQALAPGTMAGHPEAGGTALPPGHPSTSGGAASESEGPGGSSTPSGPGTL
jgi:tetratricopeptide (TPR) repeat protein